MSKKQKKEKKSTLPFPVVLTDFLYQSRLCITAYSIDGEDKIDHLLNDPYNTLLFRERESCNLLVVVAIV